VADDLLRCRVLGERRQRRFELLVQGGIGVDPAPEIGDGLGVCVDRRRLRVARDSDKAKHAERE
jgi:hypothetical protein